MRRQSQSINCQINKTLYRTFHWQFYDFEQSCGNISKFFVLALHPALFQREKFFDYSILVTCSFCLTVVFHIETGHLFGRAKQVTDFYMKRSTGLKWVKLVKRVVYVEFV